jgi:hypothetical protein
MNQTMRFSEAIRLGATMHEQAFGLVFETRALMPMRTCAWGAAIQAAGLPLAPSTGGLPDMTGRDTPGPSMSVMLPAHWVAVIEQAEPCPLCRKAFKVGALVAHLNDFHRLTRTDIADIVERVERYVYGDARKEAECALVAK